MPGDGPRPYGLQESVLGGVNFSALTWATGRTGATVTDGYEATLRLAYEHLTDELQDVRKQVGDLAQTLQTLPAVGAVTLALFAALATLPTFRDVLPTLLLVLGLAPFVVLVVVSIQEFGRGGFVDEDLVLSSPQDVLPVEDWLMAKISDRRLEINTLRGTILRKRDRLRLSSALLAIQVGYLLVITVAVTFLGGDP